MMRRRELLVALGATLVAAPAAAGGSPHYELRDLTLPGDPRIGQRMTLLVPRHAKGKVPLLVLLHGLGETHDPRLGAYAWVERYGLGGAYERLRTPPVERIDKVRYWDDRRLAEVNRMLRERPFEGLAIACPYTPNVYKAANRARMLDDYAAWIAAEVLPRARREANVFADARRTYLDGCSLGGYVGIEVFLRKPELFGAWGSLQGALGDHRIAGYADKMKAAFAQHGPRPIHLETSTGDAFRKTNEAFSRLLQQRGIDHDFIMPPGPHNQPFLRDSGTLEMLLWFDRLPR